MNWLILTISYFFHCKYCNPQWWDSIDFLLSKTLLEGLSETQGFHLFFVISSLSIFLILFFLYHKLYSLLLSLYPKNKTLAHLLLSVGNHPKIVVHQFWYQSKSSWLEGICNWGAEQLMQAWVPKKLLTIKMPLHYALRKFQPHNSPIKIL